jgi:two-component sensor histidine kinase
MRRRKHNFRFHLGVLGALTAVPFILAGAVMALLYVNSQRQATEHDLVSAARDLSNAIDRQIDGGLITLRAMSFSQALERGELGIFYSQAARVAGIFPGSAVVLRGADGQQILSTALEWGAMLPRTSDPVVSDADRKALSTMRPVISNLFTGASTGRHYVAIYLPIDYQGSPHLLTLALPPESVLGVIRQSSVIQPDWLVSVIDANHRVVARNRDHDNYVGRSASENFVQLLAGNEGVVTSTTLDGTDVRDGYYKSPLTGWTVITAVPVSSINKSVRDAAMAVGIAGALGLICSLVFAGLYSHYITPPIWRLRNEALGLSQRKPMRSFNTGITELDAVSESLASASASLIRDEEAKSQMIKELNHRVKNSLATVLSIARQSSAKTDNFTEFYETFSGRLIALSQSHDALSEGEWVEADIRELVQRICVNVAGPERVTAHGPRVPLYPRAALTMGMMLHELCANAAKYGALAQPEGTIVIDWGVQPHAPGGPTFSLKWTERGGPPVEPPEKKSFGTRFIDESIRHAVTKLAHVHFPANAAAADRIIRMGEPPDTVHVVGCPRIDLVAEVARGAQGIPKGDWLDREGVGAHIDLTRPFLLVNQHPVTTEYGHGKDHVRETLEALDELKMPTIMLWPNVDAGSDDIATGMRTFRETRKPDYIRFYKNFPIDTYVRLMLACGCAVGNSSAPIREGAFLGVPAVNIGTRQAGRDRGANVVDAGYDRHEIVAAVRRQLAHGRYAPDHMYGDGQAGPRVADVLARTVFRVQKRLVFTQPV